jgi:holin-like protein
MKLMLQIGVVFGICLIGQAVSVFLPIAVPGSVISMVLLFLLLFFRVLKVDHIRQKADFLLKNMAFFFIPAGVGILANFAAVRDHILPLLAVIVLTTILTFGATAITVRMVIALQGKLGGGKTGSEEESHE